MRKQRLNDVQSRVGAAATRAHVESPLRTELFMDSCSVGHQGNCCASTREIPATWISTRAQGTERCSCDKLRSNAASTLGSLPVCKETCSGEKTAAFSRREHSWISLRAQTDMFVCDNVAAFARCEHTCNSLRAQKDMFR